MRKIIHETDCPIKRSTLLFGALVGKIIHETDCPIKLEESRLFTRCWKIIHETDCPIKRGSLGTAGLILEDYT